MQKMELSATQRIAFSDAIRSSHTRVVQVQVRTLSGDLLADISDWVLDGEIIVDTTADVTRALTMSLLDPEHSLSFDTDSPNDGALYADRMIKVIDHRWVEALGTRVRIDIFTGPVTKIERDGAVISLEAQGKESLANGAIWRPLVIKKGTKVTDAIKILLGDRGGETRFDFPDDRTKLLRTRNFDRYSRIWPTATALAKSMNHELFYDGRGVAVLRKLPNTPLWTFKDGNGGDILTQPQISYEMNESVVNTVVVKGGKPRGAKEYIHVIKVAEKTNPLSPWRLGRNGVPRHLVETVTDRSLRTNKAANERAQQILNDRLRSVVDVTLDVLPIPHMDPNDLVRVKTDDFTVDFRLTQFTLPLATSGDPVMSIGYHRKTTVNRRRIRR